jgi:hypothetical protein
LDITSTSIARTTRSSSSQKTTLEPTPKIWYFQIHTPLIVGPIIRLGPKLISTQGTDVIQTIYGTSSTWKKPSPASQIITKPRHGVLGGTASLDDVKCRNILEPSFSSEAIAAQQHVIQNCADTALTVTEIACENDEGRVDVLQIARTYAFDVISIAFF